MRILKMLKESVKDIYNDKDYIDLIEKLLKDRIYK